MRLKVMGSLLSAAKNISFSLMKSPLKATYITFFILIVLMLIRRMCNCKKPFFALDLLIPDLSFVSLKDGPTPASFRKY